MGLGFNSVAAHKYLYKCVFVCFLWRCKAALQQVHRTLFPAQSITILKQLLRCYTYMVNVHLQTHQVRREALSCSDSLLLHVSSHWLCHWGPWPPCSEGPTAKTSFHDGELNPASDKPLEFKAAWISNFSVSVYFRLIHITIKYHQIAIRNIWVFTFWWEEKFGSSPT